MLQFGQRRRPRQRWQSVAPIRKLSRKCRSRKACLLMTLASRQNISLERRVSALRRSRTKMATNLKDAIIEHFTTQALLKWVAAKRKDRGTMNFLTGYKTYIVAGVLLLICVLQLFGISIPGVPAISPGDAIGGI